MSYPAKELLGRTLIARTRVPYKAAAEDTAEAIGYFEPGTVVGVIYSFLEPRVGRSNLYWQFRTSSGRWYYVEHLQGRFDERHLINQGTRTSTQLREIQRRADLNVAERFLEDHGGFVKSSVNKLVIATGIGIVGFAIVKAL